jgi:alkanesulfonate monooxygenase SsuD/methylene tetrahydromethanopterin reductase-like flavin-dependent oxidoreductase (luciferase family)
MHYGISLSGTPLNKLGEFAKMAEDAGFELAVVDDNRGPGDVFVKVTAMALGTTTIQVGTGICRAFVRTPISTGSAAMTIDDLSGGRMVLCLGGGTRRQLDFGIEIEHGAPQLKEVIEIIRLLWANHPVPFEYKGRFYQLQGAVPGTRQARGDRRERHIPVYIATVREAATRMMGEVADGSAGHPDWHIRYINEVVLPNLAIGLKRAGRERKDFDLTCWRICHIATDGVDRKTARREAARHVANYLQVRSYSILLDSGGWTKEKEAIYDAALVRRDPEALTDAITDEMLDAMALVGTPDEVRKQAAAFEGILDRIVLIGGDEHNKRAMMEVFGPKA